MTVDWSKVFQSMRGRSCNHVSEADRLDWAAICIAVFVGGFFAYFISRYDLRTHTTFDCLLFRASLPRRRHPSRAILI
jgi:hypothetical protein